MAEKLARMYGTEEDKVNCPFYFKIGACRYESKCLRIHNRPPYSQTILIKHMYENSPIELAIASGNRVSEDDAKKALYKFENFYEEVFLELANYGELEDLIVCDNIGDHMIGNIYVKFTREKDARKCMEGLRTRYYDGKLLQPEFSPVTDFSNAKCKQFIEGSCKRGGYCNYMHLKPVSNSFKRSLFKQMYEEHSEFKRRRHDSDSEESRNKSKSKSKSRNRSEDRKKKSKKHRDRSKEKSEKKQKKQKKKNSKSPSQREMDSEERRKMISNWNDTGVNESEERKSQGDKEDSK